MIALHAGIIDGEFLLWGETPAEVDAPKPKKSKYKGSLRTGLTLPKSLPYDAGVKRLSTALKEIGFDSRISKKSIAQTIAWLPTADNKPIPSSTLINEFDQSTPAATLTPWKVTTFRLRLEKTIEFLCSCVGKQVLGPGMIVGKDLTFWTTAMRFAGALVAKQQFLPGVSEIDGVYLAHWKPVFSGLDHERFLKLDKALPAVARALTRGTVSPPNIPSISVLTGFITMVVDYLVRSSIATRFPTLKLSTHGSIHDLWLDTLCSPDIVMKSDAKELSQLTTQIKEWERPISFSSATPFRLCFRMEEPDGNGEKNGILSPKKNTWYVRYLLQGTQDPSLLIPAEKVWKGENISLTDREDFNMREYLLLSLGQASRICRHIEASLRASSPMGYNLEDTGAYEFLTQTALVLEQWGFGVILPASWTRKGTKLRLTVGASVKAPEMRGVSGLSLDRIVQFNWEVALGDEKLSYEELQRLANLKVPLIRMRGQWVQVDKEAIQAALELWKKRLSEQATVRKVIQMALGGRETPGGMPFEGIVATGWIADLLAELDGRLPFREVSAPEGFQGTLRPYQLRGYSWLNFLRKWGLGACLADDMGLGKTIQTLALIQRDWESGKRSPVLLVCPTSVVSNWQKEASRFTPELPVLVHHGIERMKGGDFKTAAAHQAIVISSYALLHRDFETLKEVNWAGVVLDEAQNIKNPETKQAKTAREIKGEYRIALTGTPVENNIGDLWSIMEFLNPGFLGTQREFKRKFFIPIQAGRDPEAVEGLKRLTSPFILRRLKIDKTIIADLPEKMEMKVFCPLTREQATLYEAVVKETMRVLDETEGIRRKGLVLATLLKLKQVCNHPAQFLGDNSPIPRRSGKLARLTEMVEEMIEVGDQVLVFTQFAEMGEILQRYLQETFGREVLYLHGGVPKIQRDKMIERFQAGDGGPSLFILSLKAGGLGLNLTRASRVIHFDRWWNPAVENQATDRAFRIGQTKNVQVHKFICTGTLEERIDEMIERKKEIADKVIGTGEAWLTELSTAELKSLFTLRKEAVGE